MSPANPPVNFKCAACGISLAAPPSQAGVSGPCPSCGAWITAPPAPEIHDPAPALVRKKGLIPADVAIDHTHLEKRESLKTLKVLALFALAICGCLAAAWFLRDWISR